MNKNRNYNLKKTIDGLVNRSLISIVLIMSLLLINKFNSNFLSNFKNTIFNRSFNFVKINSLSKKFLGKEFIYSQKKSGSIGVMNEDLISGESHKYYDGEKYIVSSNLPIGTVESGVVIFVGDKQHFKNTVIIQGTDNYNIWYGNLKDVSVNLYEYVEKNSLIGLADGNEVYMLIEKDNNYYSYEDYKKSKN